MKKILRILLTTATLSLVLAGCHSTSTSPKTTSLETEQPTIVTTLFPEYDFTKKIVGSHAKVTLLLPPGVEPHNFEPTPKDMVQMKKAMLLIYTNDIMEPWISKFKGTLKGDSVKILNASESIQMIQTHGSDDPHVWMNPQNAILMAKAIQKAVVEADPTHKQLYDDNTTTLIQELSDLDAAYEKALSPLKNKQVIYGGHAAEGYLADRYKLEFISAYNSLSPDAEPTSKNIATLIDTVKSTHAKAVYYEELVDPKVAKVIAAETHAKMLLLHGAHNLSLEELNQNVSYIDIMKDNLDRLLEGLQ